MAGSFGYEPGTTRLDENGRARTASEDPRHREDTLLAPTAQLPSSNRRRAGERPFTSRGCWPAPLVETLAPDDPGRRRGGAGPRAIAFAGDSSRVSPVRLGAGHHSPRHVFRSAPFALAVFAIVDFANGLRWVGKTRATRSLGDIARMVPLMIVGIVTVPRCSSTSRATRRSSRSGPSSSATRSTASRGAAPGTVSRNWRSSPDSAAASRNALRAEGRLTRSISPPCLEQGTVRATMTLTTIFSIGLRLIAFA